MNALASRLDRIEKILIGEEKRYIIIHGGSGEDYPPTPEEIAEARRTGNCCILRGMAKELME